MGGKRITDDTRDKIISMFRQGLTREAITRLSPVSRFSVDRIIRDSGLTAEFDYSKYLTLEQIQAALPLCDTAIWRIIKRLHLEPVARDSKGRNYYYPHIVDQIKRSVHYQKAISRRIHKKSLRLRPKLYEQSKDVMLCRTCRYLKPAYNPDTTDYLCDHFRGRSKIHNLNEKPDSCGCFLWEIRLAVQDYKNNRNKF